MGVRVGHMCNLFEHMCMPIYVYNIYAQGNACVAHVTSSTWAHVYTHVDAQYICTLLKQIHHLLEHMCMRAHVHNRCAYGNACIAHVTSSTWAHVYAYMYAQYICTLLGHMCVSMFMHTCMSLYMHNIYAYGYACIARFTSSTWAHVYALWMCILEMYHAVLGMASAR